ncbi:MAG TPA: SCO family protein [Polyangiaceae bacterium]|nr:SCO family protein [Polyangiaceae bacterium]
MNPFRTATLAALLSGLVACGRAPSTDAATEAPSPSAAPTPPVRPPAEDAANGVSVYDLQIQISDEHGKRQPLDEFRGHPVLISMFYAGCPNVCPMLTSDLEKIDRLVPEPERENLRILMVSFDAARDTPEVLTRLMARRSLDPSRWTFASAAEDDARQLAAVLGIRYRKLDNGEFYHSTAIVLLDAQGRVLVRSDGLGKDPAPILSALVP